MPEHSIAGAYDQLDLCDSAIIETIARRARFTELQYRELAREGLRGPGLDMGAAPSLAGSSVLGGEEADLFDGVGKVAGGVMVAPAIVEFVGEELENGEDHQAVAGGPRGGRKPRTK